MEAKNVPASLSSLFLCLMVMASVDGWLDPRRGKRETNNNIYYGARIIYLKIIYLRRIESIEETSEESKVDSTRIFFCFFLPYYYISILLKSLIRS